MLTSSLISRFGCGQFTKPIFLFALMALTISTVFTTFILTGSTAPGLRKFYLLSLRYASSAASSKLLTDLLPSSSSDAFATVRVGYRGLCIERSSGWTCARNSAAGVARDPLDLVAIADIYRGKIAFAAPVWLALVALGAGWVGVAANCVPGVPVPAWTRRAGVAACAVGSLALLGAMVLQQVTSGAVSTLVDKMGMAAIEVHVGRANAGFGWAAFALALLGTAGIAAVVVAEWGIEAAQAKVLEKTEDVVERGFSTVSFANDESAPRRPLGTQASLGTSSMRNAVVDKGLQYGGSLLKSSLRK